MNRNHLRVGAAAVAALLAFAGCGARSDTTDESTSGGDANKTVKIGVIAPLSGDLSSFGAGIRNSVELAIREANESGAIPGWTIELAAEDDQATPDVGQNAATKLAGDDTVAGVVGTMNSSVAQPVIPVLDAANIPMVSPANTLPALTKGADLTNPVRPNANFFRLCASDDKQGPFAAQYLLDSGITKVATVHDKKVYGKGLVDEFAKYFEANGGEIVAAETINPDDKDYNTVITKIKEANPEAIYYGGESPQAGPLSAQAKAAGLNVPLMGGDGLYDASFIDLAGAAGEGDLATSVGAPVDTLASAKAFVDAYNAAGFDSGYSAYGAYAYDAANTIIEALKVTLPGAADVKSVRAQIVEAVGKVSFTGATGDIAFDEFGDNKSRVLTVYKVESGAWTPVKSGEA
ncbi:MAG: branched-chain amino acid ABC transporter substrate-binding protein [Propionibacteriaceae bacterium]|jgi:branched-chain amino acid transport system substrate-binding protein|nr:branched-chain amino acid ABC transporter substrate-binding protein [Propionibacteriaceae bacterium]